MTIQTALKTTLVVYVCVLAAIVCHLSVRNKRIRDTCKPQVFVSHFEYKGQTYVVCTHKGHFMILEVDNGDR